MGLLTAVGLAATCSGNVNDITTQLGLTGVELDNAVASCGSIGELLADCNNRINDCNSSLRQANFFGTQSNPNQKQSIGELQALIAKVENELKTLYAQKQMLGSDHKRADYYEKKLKGFKAMLEVRLKAAQNMQESAEKIVDSSIKKAFSWGGGGQG